MKLISFVKRTHLPGQGGWGNGYVAVPKGHPCYGMDYDNIHSTYDIDVHGGITWSNNHIQDQPAETIGMWILGFDTLHFGDDESKWPDGDAVMRETDRFKEQLEALIPKETKVLEILTTYNDLRNRRNQ